MRSFYIAIVIVVAGMGALVAAQEPGSLSGFYRCQGQNAEGQDYEALLQVVEEGPVIYARWIYAQSPPTLGIGFIRDGVVIIGYHGGVIAYPLVKGEMREGQWVTVGDSNVHREVLTKVKMPVNHPVPQFAPPPDGSGDAVVAPGIQYR